MVELGALWLPILLSAVFVFLASSVIHMALPYHKSDCGKLANEDAVRDGVRKANPAPGEYMFPRPNSMKEMADPEMVKKYKEGPVGMLIVFPNDVPAMGKALFQWFVYCVFVSFTAAYLSTLALPNGVGYSTVFRFIGTIAIVIYGTCNVTNSIWKGSSWMTTSKFALDGVIYGLVTAGTFGWLWPAA
jgi:hypothetical protein